MHHVFAHWNTVLLWKAPPLEHLRYMAQSSAIEANIFSTCGHAEQEGSGFIFLERPCADNPNSSACILQMLMDGQMAWTGAVLKARFRTAESSTSLWKEGGGRRCLWFFDNAPPLPGCSSMFPSPELVLVLESPAFVPRRGREAAFNCIFFSFTLWRLVVCVRPPKRAVLDAAVSCQPFQQVSPAVEVWHPAVLAPAGWKPPLNQQLGTEGATTLRRLLLWGMWAKHKMSQVM